MASEEENLNLSACREVLRSFSLSNIEASAHAHAYHDSLMHHQVAVEDALEMAWVDAKRRSMEQIIEEKQVHRVQVATLSQMQH